MLRTQVRRALLTALRAAGIFQLVAGSAWRSKRLLILCYHGTSLEDEHQWRPSLYVPPETLEQRMELLRRGRYSVLPLGEGLQRLHSGTLPQRSVALTFDDGTYDFYRQAFPLLRSYSFPATVYQTTYYTQHELPVFNLVCSYMLWKRRGMVVPDGQKIGLPGPLDLHDEPSRHRVVRGLIEAAERVQLTGEQKDDLAARLAELLGVDYAALKARRILQLMNHSELEQVARAGIDLQLHTHRHRTPMEEALFRREIQDNRDALQGLGKAVPVHFCYPSGVHRPEMLPWLRDEGIESATTCDAGLATRASDPLLLPRFVDNQNRQPIDFESWTTGVGELLAVRRAASQVYVPGEQGQTD
jgi:peptidoglycan/xylan/chitin deacetylase (PgdA/CDA1 family)